MPAAHPRHRPSASRATGRGTGCWCAGPRKLPATSGRFPPVPADFSVDSSACFVINKGEVAVVVGDKGAVLPADRQRQFGGVDVRGVNKPVCSAACTKLLSSPSTMSALLFCLPYAGGSAERRHLPARRISVRSRTAPRTPFNRRAGAPFGGERVVGVDGERRRRQKLGRTITAERAKLFQHVALLEEKE